MPLLFELLLFELLFVRVVDPFEHRCGMIRSALVTLFCKSELCLERVLSLNDDLVRLFEFELAFVSE